MLKRVSSRPLEVLILGWRLALEVLSRGGRLSLDVIPLVEESPVDSKIVAS